MQCFKNVVAMCLLGSVLTSNSLTAQQQIGPINSSPTPRAWANDESIEQISKSVFRFGSDNQFGAYIVTDEGIIVVDGHYCGSTTTEWLKLQLEERYDVPVRYVILSHDHPNHTCGTKVFGDTAIAIGSRNIRPHMIFENRQSLVPQITFNDEMDLHLGGVDVRLIFLGPTHSDNLIQIHIPEERVLIAIDSAKGFNLMPDVRDMDVNNQLLAWKTLAHMPDVDVVLPGHGPVTDQQAFADAAKYMDSLRMTVLELMAEGRSLQEIKELASVRLMRSLEICIDQWTDFC